MNSLYLHMIWPEEWPLVMIIIVLFMVVFWTICLCIRLRQKIQISIRTIERLSEADSLAYLENSLKMKNIDYAATFEKYEIDNEKMSNNEAVFEHIHAIYDAGRKSSRLDADLLVKNTVSKICDNVDTIKSCISIFLVIGILGTLVGLGISIGSFNGDSFIINAKANNTALELSKLFGNLRGAFAPSMWGVFMTIVFVICYTVFIQQGCINKLEDKLTTSTIKIWLPSLYPTDFQKGETTMVQLKDTIRNAEQINVGADNLVNNLSEANASVQALNSVAVAVKDSADRFSESSAKVTALEAAVAALSQQITLNSENYQKWMSNALQSSSDYHEKVKDSFVEEAEALKQNFSIQNQQLTAIVQTLKLYDDKSLMVQNYLNEALTKAVSDNDKAISRLNQVVDDLDRRNQDVIITVGEPLRRQLDNLGQSISRDLSGLTKAIDKIDNPLTKTATDIQKMFKNILNSMNEIMAAKAGLTKEEIELLTRNASSTVADVNVDTSGLENRLEDILRCLEKQNISLNKEREPQIIYATGTKGEQEKKKSFLQDNIMMIAIAVLMVVSIIIQGMMVLKLGNIQESQNQLYRIVSESSIGSNQEVK